MEESIDEKDGHARGRRIGTLGDDYVQEMAVGVH